MSEEEALRIFFEPKLKKWMVVKGDERLLMLAVSAVRPVRTELVSVTNTKDLDPLLNKAAINVAIDLLSKRDYLQVELKKKLEARGIPEKNAKRALSRLEKEGLLDDKRYIRAYTFSKEARYGKGMLRVKLLAKGADKRLVDEHLSTVGSEAERALIEKALSKAKRKGEDLTDLKSRHRWIQRLLRRGCSFELLRSILDEHLSSYRDSEPFLLEEHFPQ